MSEPIYGPKKYLLKVGNMSEPIYGPKKYLPIAPKILDEEDQFLKDWESSTVGNEFGSPDCKESIWNKRSSEQIQNALDETPSQSLRLNSGKPQLMEIDPAFILGLAEVLTKSQAKYSAFNWAKPTKLSVPFDSLQRHLLAFQAGEDVDPDDGLPHLLKAAVNIMFLHYHNTNNPEESDDRFFKKEKK